MQCISSGLLNHVRSSGRRGRSGLQGGRRDRRTSRERGWLFLSLGHQPNVWSVETNQTQCSKDVKSGSEREEGIRSGDGRTRRGVEERGLSTFSDWDLPVVKYICDTFIPQVAQHHWTSIPWYCQSRTWCQVHNNLDLQGLPYRGSANTHAMLFKLARSENSKTKCKSNYLGHP